MILELIVALALSLIMTLVLEIGFFFVTGKRNKKDFLLVVLVNVLTNPIVVLLYWLAYLYTNWNMTIVIIPLEISAVLTEGFFYMKYAQSIKRPFIFSITANAFSYFLGILIQRII